MYMKNSLLLSFLFATILLSSCGRRVITGSGVTDSQVRTVTAFNMIDIEAPVDATIHVQPGAQPSVTLSGYSNLLNEIRTEVEGSTLKIANRNSINFDTDKDVSAEITVSSLSDLAIHGAADAIVKGNVTGSDFKLKISGAGDVSIEKLTVGNLTAGISGAGDVDINGGSANEAHFTISGAGNIKTYNLQANDVSAKVSGAGDMEVTALRSLDAKVSGAGSIRYKGHPALKSKTSGIGEIAAAD
jgi:hypothetical protein